MAGSTPTKIAYPPRPPLPRDGSPDPSIRPSLAQPNGDPQAGTPRRTSFGFLRRKSSAEARSVARRSTSGAKMSRKQKVLAKEEALRRQREAAMLPKQPPRLPSHSALPVIDTFGGESAPQDQVAIVSNKIGSYNFSRPTGSSMDQPRMAYSPSLNGAPPMPSYMDYDPYPRTESMTNRGRYSYASSLASAVNSPRRVRRRKDPTPFK